MENYEVLLSMLRLNGVNVEKALSLPYDEASVQRYLSRLEEYLRSFDFMRLGQSINHEQWSAAQMKSSRMHQQAMQLGLTEFSRQLQGIRQAAAAKNKAEASQILALIIPRRVKLLELFAQKE